MLLTHTRKAPAPLRNAMFALKGDEMMVVVDTFRGRGVRFAYKASSKVIEALRANEVIACYEVPADMARHFSKGFVVEVDAGQCPVAEHPLDITK